MTVVAKKVTAATETVAVAVTLVATVAATVTAVASLAVATLAVATQAPATPAPATPAARSLASRSPAMAVATATSAAVAACPSALQPRQRACSLRRAWIQTTTRTTTTTTNDPLEQPACTAATGPWVMAQRPRYHRTPAATTACSTTRPRRHARHPMPGGVAVLLPARRLHQAEQEVWTERVVAQGAWCWTRRRCNGTKPCCSGVLHEVAMAMSPTTLWTSVHVFDGTWRKARSRGWW